MRALGAYRLATSCKLKWNLFICLCSYGDRYPRSMGGRLFAVMWILVGMVIISIFTAALTSSLTTLSLETQVKLPGAKVSRSTIWFEIILLLIYWAVWITRTNGGRSRYWSIPYPVNLWPKYPASLFTWPKYPINFSGRYPVSRWYFAKYPVFRNSPLGGGTSERCFDVA